MKMVVDKAGRTVIPKPLRRALNLQPGGELDAFVEDGQLIAKPVGANVVLMEENGRLVFTTVEPIPAMTTEELLQLIHDLREERLDELTRGNTPAGQ